jgi:hypothetical protein
MFVTKNLPTNEISIFSKDESWIWNLGKEVGGILLVLLEKL